MTGTANSTIPLTGPLAGHVLMPPASPAPLLVGTTSIGKSGLIAIVALLIGLFFFNPFVKHQRQRLVPGIPIVGGSDKAAIKKSRTRFIHDGMAMLAEGYQQVGRHAVSRT